MEILGIDVGGSGIKGSVVDLDTGIILQERIRIETPENSTPENIAMAIIGIKDQFSWTGKIGCGFPAIVKNGVIHSASNISKKNIGVNVTALFSEITKCEVTVLNDADAAAMCEVYLGEAKNTQGIVILLTIGTGIGSALFNNGILLPNTEFGHIYMNKGKVAEHYASDLVRKKEDLSWDKWAIRFSEYLNYLDFLFSPGLFIIGGGVSKKFEKFAPFLTINVPIKPASFLNDAGIIGAAIAAGLNNKV